MSILLELGQAIWNKTIILLYGGRSAVSVLSAESVMRAVNYDRFTVKTFFISQSGGLFIKTQALSQTPGQEYGYQWWGGDLTDGANIANHSSHQRTNYRREDVGFVFQSYNLVSNLTARENVELAL